MFEKVVGKGTMMRAMVIILIASVLILTLNVLSASKDGRKQIIDQDGGSEERLFSVLSSIKGAGTVEAAVQYDDQQKVVGVIVTAEGGGNPIVASKLTSGVATLYNIPVSSVIVFEKEQEEQS